MVRRGADRQECHESLRRLSQEAAAEVKEFGRDNDLLDRIRASDYFAPIHASLEDLVDAKTFIGRAPQQVRRLWVLKVLDLHSFSSFLSKGNSQRYFD